MGGIDLSPVINLWLQWIQNWNLIIRGLKGKIAGKTLIILEAENSDISHSLEASLEESDRGYKICGDEVASLQPYDEIMRHEIIYQRTQKEERGVKYKGAK